MTDMVSPSRITVQVVDDHVGVAESTSNMLASWFRVLPPASTIDEILAPRDPAQVADVVLLDLALGEVSALTHLPELAARWPATVFVIYSMHLDAIFADTALRAGAAGYITKTCAMTDVRDAIEDAYRGKVVVRGVRSSVPPPAHNSNSRRIAR